MSKPNTSIVVSGTPEAPTSTLRLTLDASSFITEALAQASGVIEVTDKAEEAAAISACAVLKGIVADIEKSRKQWKEPYLNAGKEIDSFAKTESDPIKEEFGRLEAELGKFAKAEQAKIDAENARRAKEIEDARKAKEAEERKAEEAKREADRLAAEAERLRVEAEQAKGKKAKLEAAQRAEEASKAAQAQSAVAEDLEIAASFNEAPALVLEQDKKASGAAVKVEFDVEVTDPAALYRAFPQFVKLIPEIALLKSYVNQPGSVSSIPGVKITESTKVQVRKVSTGLLKQRPSYELPND